MDIIYVIVIIMLLTFLLWKVLAGRTRHVKGTLSVTKANYSKVSQRVQGLYFLTVSFKDRQRLYHSAYQMNIHLPAGCCFVAPEAWKEYAVINKKGGVYPKLGRDFDHTIGSALRAKNHLFVMLFDGSNNKPFLKHSGRLFDVCIKVPENTDISSLQIAIRDIQFRSVKGSKYYYEDQKIRVVKP